MRASAFPNSGLHVGMCVVRARVRFPSPTTPPSAAACVRRIPAAAGDWPTRGTRRSGVQWAAEQAGRAQVSFRSACGPPVAAAARVRRIAEQLPQTCALHWLPCGCTPPRLA